MSLSPNPDAATPPPTRGARWRASIRERVHAMVMGLVPSDSAVIIARTDERMEDAHFDEALCRNCGMVRTEPHCGGCGQKAVARLDLKDVYSEFWQAWRLFEASMIKGSLEMVRAPGTIAREYVLGARKRHIHPLKLLLFAVGLMVIVMHKTQWLTAGQAQLTEQMKLVESWSRWSFSLSLFAILFTSLLMFRGRLGYNAVEHLVLAVYAQFLVVVAKLLNMLPLWLLGTGWTPAWREASKFYMTPVECLIVAVAYQQFFRLRWRRDGVRIALALIVFLVFKRALQYGYGRFVHQMLLLQSG